MTFILYFVVSFLCRPGRKRDFTPLPWSQYFETIEDVEVENDNSKDISFASIPSRPLTNCAIFMSLYNMSLFSANPSFTPLYTFRIYSSGSHGPVLLLLHGGGHSALSWAVFTVSFLHILYVYKMSL